MCCDGARIFSSNDLCDAISAAFGFSDDNILQWYILVTRIISSFDLLDFIDDILPFHDLAKNTVAKTLRSGCTIIQKSYYYSH